MSDINKTGPGQKGREQKTPGEARLGTDLSPSPVGIDQALTLRTGDFERLRLQFHAFAERSGEGSILDASQFGPKEKRILGGFMAKCQTTFRSLLNGIASSPRGVGLHTVKGERVDTASLEIDILEGVVVKRGTHSSKWGTAPALIPAAHLRITSDTSQYYSVDPLFHGVEELGDAPFTIVMSQPDSPSGGFAIETHCSPAALEKLITQLKIHEHSSDGNARRCPSPLLSIATTAIEIATKKNFPAEPITLLERFRWQNDAAGGYFEMQVSGEKYAGRFQLDEKNHISFILMDK